MSVWDRPAAVVPKLILCAAEMIIRIALSRLNSSQSPELNCCRAS